MANWWDQDEIVAPAPAPVAPAPATAASANWWDGDEVVQPAAPAPAAPARRSWADTFRALGDSAEASAVIPLAVAQAPVQANAMPYAESVGRAAGALAGGVDRGVRLLANGATLGTIDKVAAGLNTGFGFLGDYPKELARQRGIDAETEAALPVASTLLKGAGSAAGMVALQGVGIPVFGAAGRGLGVRTTQAAGYGGAIGFGAGAVNEDNDRDKVLSGAKEGVAHGIAGAAGPLGGAALGGLFGFGSRQLAGRLNPEAYAAQRVGRALRDSGRTVDDVADTLAVANAEGSPFMVADAMGYSGRRSLAGVAKSPGPGREAIVEALEQRQAGQGQRLAEAVTQAFDSPETARNTTEGLYRWAADASEPFYKQALAQAPVWSERLNQFLKDPISQQGIRRGMEIQRLEALAKGEKFDPFDIIEGVDKAGELVLTKVPNMRTVNVLKKGLDDILEGYRDTTTGKLVLDEKGRAIDQVRRAFLGEVDALNPEFAKARALYATPMQIKDAVAAGRQVGAGRARTADSIARFDALPDEATQQGFRIGYVDPILGRIERAADGVNKARPFTSDASRAEIARFAREGEAGLLSRRIEREGEMFRTRAEALGNSKTAENLADMAAQRGIDPGALSDALALNAPGLFRRGAARIAQVLEGASEQSLDAAGRLLLSRDPNALRAALRVQADAQARRDAIATALARGTANYGLSTYRASR